MWLLFVLCLFFVCLVCFLSALCYLEKLMCGNNLISKALYHRESLEGGMREANERSTSLPILQLEDLLVEISSLVVFILF